MVMMKYFCFYFPVRTGVLITSFLSSLQSMGLLAYCIMKTAEDFKNIATEVKIHIDDYSSNQAFEISLDFVIQHNENLRLGGIAFSGAYISACVLNMLAALKIWRWLSVPFILLELMRLCGIFAANCLAMMVFKKQLNLGVLIAACSVGGFIILYLAYMWACSVAFFQIVGIVRSKSYQKMKSLSSPPPEKLRRNITISTVASNINVKPLKPNTPDHEMFASDFSEYYRKSSFRM